ncbi:MAG: hypothetical protein MJ075_00060 [Oscillospiraceae bacterium]|nr:hypothetical protein [Oscillospiraceae bacterium]
MYTFPTVTERIARLRKRYRDELPGFDSERVRIVTEYYQAHPHENQMMRRANAMYKILEGVPLRIEPDELLVGNSGKYYKGSMLFPEYNDLSWLPREIASGKFDNRTLQEARCFMSQEDRDYICGVVDYWQDHNANALSHFEMTPEQEAVCASGALSFGPYSRNEVHGHYNANYRKVVEKGFTAIKAEAEAELEKLNHNIGGQDAEKWFFYRAVSICCDAAILFSRRYAALAREMAATAEEPRKAELLEIAERMDWIMANPCRNYKDALQAVLLYHLILAYEGSLLGLTVGRLDGHVGDYLHRDLENGDITMAEAQEYMDCFCLKVAEIIISGPAEFMTVAGAYSDNMRLTLAGRKADGSDASCEATYLVLNTMARLKLHDPNISLCVHDDIPDSLWEAAVETNRVCGGNPTLDNADLLIEMLLKRGLSLEDARNFCIIGCVELSGSGCDFSNVSGPFSKAFFIMPQVVVQAINNGRCPQNGIQSGPATGYLYEMETFEDFKRAFAAQLAWFMDWHHTLSVLTEYMGNAMVPNPMASATIDGCMESGRDMMVGGAKYNSCGFAVKGLGTAIDSLAAVRYLVYDKKLCTARELYDALLNNWEGCESLRQAAKNAPAFGNADPYVDELASWLSDMFSQRVSGYTGPRGPFQAGAYSAGGHVASGYRVPATPNGRRSGEALSDGASPTQGADRCGPTGVAGSILALHPERYWNGIQFNMKFHPSCVQGQEGIEKMRSFVQSFFRMGGTQVQYNIVSSDTLRKAQANPDEYRDLVVRVAGFSAFFVELVPDLQNDLIRRTEVMM